MDGDDPESQVFDTAAAETRHFHTFEQLALGRELADALDEVLIAVPVLGDDLAHFRDQAVGIFVVDFGEEGFLYL